MMNLGNEAHRKQYFDDIASLRLPGCFAMTELKHGSNVAGLQTEAVLDLMTDEWVVHTPDEGAIKWWIGNAAEDGEGAPGCCCCPCMSCCAAVLGCMLCCSAGSIAAGRSVVMCHGHIMCDARHRSAQT